MRSDRLVRAALIASAAAALVLSACEKNQEPKGEQAPPQSPPVAAPVPAAPPSPSPTAATSPAKEPTAGAPTGTEAQKQRQPAAADAKAATVDAGAARAEQGPNSTGGLATAAAPPAEAPKATAGGEKYKIVAVPAPDKKTERAWKSKCSSCHGASAKGDTEQGKKMAIPDMTQAKWQTAHSNEELKNAILNGVNTTTGGVKQQMDPFKDDLAPDQVDALVQYVRWLGAPH